MRCTCCLFMLTLWSAAAGCNNRMPMCIGSFSLHSKWIGLSKRYPQFVGPPTWRLRSLLQGTRVTYITETNLPLNLTLPHVVTLYYQYFLEEVHSKYIVSSCKYTYCKIKCNQEINTFIQQRGIKLIKSDCKDIYMVAFLSIHQGILNQRI